MTLKKTLNGCIKFKGLVLVFISVLSTKFGDRVLRAFIFVSILNRIKIQLKRSKITIPSRTFVKRL